MYDIIFSNSVIRYLKLCLAIGAMTYEKLKRPALTLQKTALLSLIIVTLLSGCSRESFPEPEETILEYVRLWQDAKYEDMYALLTDESRLLYTEETFIARHSNISKGISLIELSLSNYHEEALEDKIVQVTYTLNFVSGIVPQFSRDYTALLYKGEENWILDWDHNLIFPELTNRHLVRVKRDFPLRGSIFDRSDVALASPGTAREVGVVPGRIGDKEELLKSLASLLQINEESIYKTYTQSWVREDMFVPLRKITEDFWRDYQSDLLAVQGVMINKTKARIYDAPPSLSQTVGYIREINAEELALKRSYGYRAGDMIGSAGLERAYEEELAGEIGFSIHITDQQGQIVTTLAAKSFRNGSDLRTTIDLRLQNIVDDALGDHPGSAVLLDHTTGEVLVMASKPGFDPNLFSLGITPLQYTALKKLDSPFLNRAINGSYPPGSTFKPITALITLHEDILSPEDSWDTPLQWQNGPGWGNYHITRVKRPSGPVDLTKAIKWSDNVYFADLALRTGWDTFIKHGESLGFGSNIPFELNVSSSHLTKKATGDILLADTGYGQGEMLLNPLHLALMYAAIAREDGSMPQPTLLPREAGSLWMQTSYSQEHLQLIDDILKTTARDSYNIQIPGKNLRGKTGTAEISAEKQLGWFACYFDIYTLVVLLEGDRTMNSTKAMNVAKRIINEGFY